MPGALGDRHFLMQPLTKPADWTAFRSALLAWFIKQKRDLPWRRTRDPYAIWVSEIMLQQTRVAAVIPYYQRFLARFPDLQSLASAPEEELLAYWAGLGYYYRARNLQSAAQTIVGAGAFPSDYAGIRALRGVGDYTAAAIASISFDLPHAVLDGNVFRVLSRVVADDTNIASTTGKRHFAGVADEVLDRAQPGAFNQALMELGATVCLPKNPQCLLCPVAEWCRARQVGLQNDLPVKIVSRKSVHERRVLFWIERAASVLAWQRPTSARLMPGFWELPGHEQIGDAQRLLKVGEFRHGITFHNYVFEVWTAALPIDIAHCEWLEIASLKQLPISTIFRKALRLTGGMHGKATARSAAASTR
jgi:A/G-specific adenine glycosylase